MRIALTVLLAISFALGMPLLSYAWRRRNLRGVRSFLLLVISIMGYIGGYIGEINADSFAAAKCWYDLEHLFIPCQTFFWLMMCLDYSGISRRRRLIRSAMAAFVVLYWLMFFTNGLHGLYVSAFGFVSNGYFPVITAVKGPAFYGVVGFYTLVGIACFSMYLRGFMRSARLYRRNYLFLLAASLLPWGAIYLNSAQTLLLGLDWYPFTMIAAGLLYMLGIFRYNLFSTIPIATEIVYRLSEDAVALLDQGERIMDVNAAFLRLYPDFVFSRGKPAQPAFLKGHGELAGLCRSAPEHSFQRQTSGGPRHFSAQYLPIRAEGGLQIGAIVSVKDVTLYVEHASRMEALAQDAMRQAESSELSFLQAQISPHFINNTLGTIASMISRDDEMAKQLVVDLSEYLISCYRQGSSAMAPLAQELEAVDTYIRIIRARFGPRVDFAVEADSLPRMELPRLMLQPLVENAVRHGVLPRQGGGEVRLRIHQEGAGVRFEVWDNGVGIAPERIPTLLMGQDDRQGVGIVNIHKRLCKYYGEGLCIKSGAGTSVSFRVPLPAQEETP